MACTQRAHPVRSRLIRTLLLGSVLLQSALLAVSQAQITLDGQSGAAGCASDWKGSGRPRAGVRPVMVGTVAYQEEA
jgi:hypothetical protein